MRCDEPRRARVNEGPMRKGNTSATRPLSNAFWRSQCRSWSSTTLTLRRDATRALHLPIIRLPRLRRDLHLAHDPSCAALVPPLPHLQSQASRLSPHKIRKDTSWRLYLYHRHHRHDQLRRSHQSHQAHHFRHMMSSHSASSWQGSDPPSPNAWRPPVRQSIAAPLTPRGRPSHCSSASRSAPRASLPRPEPVRSAVCALSAIRATPGPQ